MASLPDQGRYPSYMSDDFWPFSAAHGLQSLLLKSNAIGRQDKYK
jgi:hypothetical protein